MLNNFNILIIKSEIGLIKLGSIKIHTLKDDAGFEGKTRRTVKSMNVGCKFVLNFRSIINLAFFLLQPSEIK